jgi:hypothetical protein
MDGSLRLDGLALLLICSMSDERQGEAVQVSPDVPGQYTTIAPGTDGAQRRFAMSHDFSQILEALQEPFPSDEVEFKPGATNREKTKALALAYVDSRPYIQRLNQVSPDWQDEYQVTTLGDRVVVVCRLTVAGITRTGDGECLLGGSEEGERVEPNAVTTASAQAFKRACVKFGLGAYLYDLPQTWCDYDAQKRKIVNPPSLPDWAVPVAERRAKSFASAVEREREQGYYVPPTVTPLEIGSDDDDTSETAPELPDPGQTIVHFGKMKGKTLAQVLEQKDGQGWLRWCASTDGNGFDPKGDPKSVYLQRQAQAFLQSLQSAHAA